MEPTKNPLLVGFRKFMNPKNSVLWTRAVGTEFRGTESMNSKRLERVISAVCPARGFCAKLLHELGAAGTNLRCSVVRRRSIFCEIR